MCDRDSIVISEYKVDFDNKGLTVSYFSEKKNTYRILFGTDLVDDLPHKSDKQLLKEMRDIHKMINQYNCDNTSDPLLLLERQNVIEDAIDKMLDIKD